MNAYATLGELRRYLSLGATQTTDDDMLWRLLDAASRLLESYTGRQFYPVRQSRCYPALDPVTLPLGDDLLTLHSLTNGDGQPIDLDAVHIQPPGVGGLLWLDRRRAVFTHQGDPLDALLVDATWGYHPQWHADLNGTAWIDSGQGILDDPLSAEAATLTISDAAALDALGWPLLEAGQLLRLDDEYLHLLAVDAQTHTLTVSRGANGTSAAQHSAATPLHIYQPPADVRQVCLRVAAWLYRQKDAGFVAQAGGLRGQVAVPPALPDDVQLILGRYVRIRVI